MSSDPSQSTPRPSADAPVAEWAELWAQAGWLRKFARQLGCEAHAAEDAVQETLLSARQSLGRDASSPSMRNWLRKAVKRRIGTGRRADARRRVREQLAAKAEAQPGDPLRALEREELGERLAAAIAELPVRDRELVALRYAAGMGPAAIASSTGLTADAVSSRLSRIHRRVRTRLERDEITSLEGRFAAPVAAITALAMNKSVTVATVGLALSVLILTWRAQRGPEMDTPTLAPPEEMADALMPVREGEPSRELTRVVLDAKQTQAELLPEVAETDPAAAPAEEVTTGSLRVEITWHDGKPASDVATLLSGPGTIGLALAHRWQTSDSAGVIELPGLRPGKYSVEADRGGQTSGMVAAGEQTIARLVLAEGLDVHGVVRDVNSVPVAGASIVATNWRYNWRGARTVATTDSDGRFLVRALAHGREADSSEGRALGAVAAGWAPSKLVDLSRIDPSSIEDGHSAELDIRLTELGADAWGTVTGPDGTPVEGAMVAIGSSSLDATIGRGHPNEVAKPRVVTTDVNGRYRLDGIAPGVHMLSARYASLPVWSAEVELPPGSRSQHDIALTSGVTVFGTVRLPNGEPAAGAILLALPEPYVDPYPSVGPTEGGSPFSHSRADSDASGHFELGPLPPGTVHLYASLGTSFLTPWTGTDPVFQGAEQVTLEGSAGQRVEWNPQLTLGLTISGRAVYADGTPLWDMFVIAVEPDGTDFATSTAKDGTFVLANLKKVTHRVTLQMPSDAPATESVEAYYDIVPPAQDLLFQLRYSPEPKVPNGTLRLRVKDTAKLGADLGEGIIVPVVHGKGPYSLMRMGLNGKGIFETDLAPGSYRIALGVRSACVLHGERIEIVSGETLDLGTLETVPLGTLEVTITRPKGFEGPVVVRTRDASGPAATIPAGTVTTTLSKIAPGNVKIDVTGQGLVKETIATEVLSGAQSQIDVQLRPASQLRIEGTLRQPRGFRRVALTVIDAAGKTWYESAKRERSVKVWPQVHETALPVGIYTVHIECADGQAGKETLVIESAGQPALVRVHAR